MSAEAGLARMTVLRYLEDGKLPGTPKDLPPELMRKAAAFVSIKKEGRLRGCIGTFEPLYASVAEEIMQNALRSAVSDPRFAPL
ncbi:MAG: AMMECR1 domain-containing protein, partial [Actinomycetia bacterium]|nr:AMMECR1 domain-containing protein [Actinomycetes bacterium]